MAKNKNCPNCAAAMAAGAVLCVSCGYDKRTGTTQSAFVKEPGKGDKPRKKKRRSAEPRPARGDVEWSDILATPFDGEYVIGETVVLTMWAALWTFLVVAVVGSFVFVSPMTIFVVSAMLAGFLRIWMISQDVSLWWLFGLFGAIAAFSLGVGLLVSSLVEGVGVVDVAFPTLLLSIVLLIILRAMSLFFGRYFGLVRRAALQQMRAAEDRGGLTDLGFAIVLMLMTGVPMFALLALAELAADQPVPIRAAAWLAVAVAGLICYFYLPMAVAAVGMRGALNPAVPLRWIGWTFADYLALLALLLPFHAAVWVVCWLIGHLLSGSAAFAPSLLAIWALLYGVLAWVVFGQYSMVVTLVALGRLLRRHGIHAN